MSHSAFAEFPCNPGRGAAFLTEAMMPALEDTRVFDGCELIEVYVDEDGGDPLAWAFGALGLHDRARHLGTLYLNDLADVIRDAVDPRFEFVRYAESLASSQPSFEPLATALAAPPTLIDHWLAELTCAAIEQHQVIGQARHFIR